MIQKATEIVNSFSIAIWDRVKSTGKIVLKLNCHNLLQLVTTFTLLLKYFSSFFL